MKAELKAFESAPWEPAIVSPGSTRPAGNAGAQIRRLWNTVRYLRPGQIYHQVRRHVYAPGVLKSTSIVTAPRRLALQSFPTREVCHARGAVFSFLNRTVDLGMPIKWDPIELPHLWRYHLHYFDYLGQPGLDGREGERLIREWMVNHRPQCGAVGWEPYPLSRRIVNWLKFFQARGALPSDVVGSLALQGANLAHQVEHHLLGNHLFANGKALWWLGVILGREKWRRQGRNLILAQLPEQFLPDGGHFELSPMYHAVLVEDLLDLVNLTMASEDGPAAAVLQRYAARGLGWLEALAGPAGSENFLLLNDSVLGLARTVAQLQDYGHRLGVGIDNAGRVDALMAGWTMHNLSGYRVFRRGPMRLLFDTAPLGPDYLPGHAHADMLSLLLDFEGKPIFTDTGVFEYAEGAARAYCRSTAAHNTVTIDDLDQAELWNSFRVARRGRPGPVQMDGHEIRCAHNGFARQRRGVGHERIIRLEDDGFSVSDELSGPEEHVFVSRFHLAPETRIAERAGQWWIDERLRLTFRGVGRVEVESTPYYPEFGRVAHRPCLVWTGKFSQRTRLELSCTSSF
jgi:uncharacterized heparinase superfamily protein